MNDNLEHIARDLKDISLTPAERLTLRHTLVAAMQLHRPSTGAWAFVLRHAAASFVLAVVAMAGTGLAAAHNSLPGDLFYPVRVAVNDRIAVAVAGDSDARLDLEVQQVARAIDEEELVMSHELAELVIVGIEAETAQPRATGHSDDADSGATSTIDLGADIELDVELSNLDRALDDEEAAADLELSL